ncbi:glycosyltransferase family 4 protein [Leucobacter sp. CX87]|uniref:glycosyltransferase family 4 protein n=1 Tax=Leucobacter sp. CX87 TaxID=2813773 RepID=UPI00165DE272|nr:glycosyltransferase family 4 protein [Leucobacter sp. cx-87]
MSIVTRIFAPEASAASFRLGTLAKSFARAGHSVSVKTVLPPRALRGTAKDSGNPFPITRFPVLRDRSGYVRGYLQYLSFDVPLFFRVLLGPKQDLFIVEPPPTTGFFVRLAAALRRTPYAYYAADVWSDAAASTGASPAVVRVVRAMERFAMSGASQVLSVNAGVTDRVRSIAPRSTVVTVGNGVDTEVFNAEGEGALDGKVAIYPGTASEWQGAVIFIEALEQILPEVPEAKIVFLGQGSDWPALQERSASLPPGSVVFTPSVPPEQAAVLMRGAATTLASLRPGTGYEFAFPTKVFASWGCGTPVIYSGPGPAREFMSTHASEARLGIACEYEVGKVADALRQVFTEEHAGADERQRTSEWASRNVSLDAVAARVIQAVAL